MGIPDPFAGSAPRRTIRGSVGKTVREVNEMSIRIRRPETARLDLPSGDWIIVKKFLTAGDERAMFWRMLRQGFDGKDKIDPLLVANAKIVAYLLDWSVSDADGNPVIIRDEGPDSIASIVDMLDPDDCRMIANAINDHETAIEREKKLTPGARAFESTLQSREPLVGATIG